jgi:broad-specificity NMP kinase
MIIEVTGPSGVGKSTYIEDILRELSRAKIKTGAIHTAISNKCLSIPSAFSELENQNIITDILAFPWSIQFALKNVKFVFFSIRSIVNNDEPLYEKIATLRSFMRKSGIRFFLNRKKYSEVVIIVDEGLFHSSHNLLCSPNRCASNKEISLFFDLCPMPDKLIMLNADRETLLERLDKRGDLSPRVSDRVSLKSFVANSHLLFTKLEALLISNKVGISLSINSCCQSNILEVGINYIIGSTLKN